MICICCYFLFDLSIASAGTNHAFNKLFPHKNVFELNQIKNIFAIEPNKKNIFGIEPNKKYVWNETNLSLHDLYLLLFSL